MAAGDLTDLATVKAWIGLNATTSDALLAALITSASTWVKSWLSRDIILTEYTELYDGNGRDMIVLRQYPIVSVASVAWVGTTLTMAGDPISQTPGFWFDGRELCLTGYCFPQCQKVRVVYSAGFASVPDDLQQTVTEWVGEAFKRMAHIGIVTSTLTGQEVTTYLQEAINKTAMQNLIQYRNVVPI